MALTLEKFAERYQRFWINWLKNIQQAWTLFLERLRDAWETPSESLWQFLRSLILLHPLDAVQWWQIFSVASFEAVIDSLGILDIFIGDIQTSQAQATITTILQEWNLTEGIGKNQVIRKSQAVTEMLNFILSTGFDVSSLHVPIPVKVYTKYQFLRKIISTVFKKGTSGAVPWATKVLGLLFGRLTKRLTFLFTNTLFMLWHVTAMTAYLILAFYFIEYVAKGQIFFGLRQDRPRRKVHPIEGGVIRRRAPGGVKP